MNEMGQKQFVSAIADMGPDYASMLLGAGTSRSSGVLLAREIVHDIVSAEYCLTNNISPETQNRLPVSEVRAWLELQPWFQAAKAKGESDYSAVFRQFKPTRDHQLRYIRSLLRDASPSKAYHGLCHLMRARYVSTILTTNFDPLIENCYKGKFATEASLRVVESPAGFERLTLESDRLILAHLHGNLNGYDIANLDEDTDLLADACQNAVKRLVGPNALIVCGYSGNDNSVMRLLESIASHDPSAFRRGVVYWCHTGNGVSPRVTNFLSSLPQSFLVEVAGFDQLIKTFCTRLKLGIDEFEEPLPPTLEELGEEGAKDGAMNIAILNSLPKTLYRYRTGLKKEDQIHELHRDHDFWQGTLHENDFWMLGDPNELPEKLVDAISGVPYEIELNEKALTDDTVWRVFIKLVNRGLKRTCYKELQLRGFRGGRFFYSMLKSGETRYVPFRNRKRRSKRKVVWLEFSRGEGDEQIDYYCHEAVRPQITRFNGMPALAIQPTRIFTVSGDLVWDTDAARVSVGRSTRMVWNEAYDALVRLWLDVFTRDNECVIIRFSADGRKPDFRLQFSSRPLEMQQIER